MRHGHPMDPRSIAPYLCFGALLLASGMAHPIAAEQNPEAHEAASQLSQQISQQISAVEWLGPLAPIALSPFFGMACLSGIATFGPEWLQQRSGVFQAASPLNNPLLFWLMAGLTVVTSLPRFTKVSKPLALLAESLEAYSVAILFVLLRLLPTGHVETELAANFPPFQAAGFAWVTLPLDVLLAVAAGLNILVINLMKFSFEIAIWLTPIPTIDAIFELVNKSMVGAMMGLYCFSPLLATLLNLTILGISLLCFDRVALRVAFYQSLILATLRAKAWPSKSDPSPDRIPAYLANKWQRLPKFTRILLVHDSQGWRVTGSRWWRRFDIPLGPCQLENLGGLITNVWSVKPHSQPEFRISRWK